MIGEAGSVNEAVAGIGHLRPDVVLLDVHLPDGGGAEVLRRVHTTQPDVVFLALSVSDAAEDVIAVIRTGARGYVTKTISGRELVDAVLRVHAGDPVFSPRLAGFVLDAFAQRPGAAPVRDPELDLLTPRERDVLRLLARGYAQGDRRGAVHLHQDGGDACLECAAQDPALQPLRALPLGLRPPAGLIRRAARPGASHRRSRRCDRGPGRSRFRCPRREPTDVPRSASSG